MNKTLRNYRMRCIAVACYDVCRRATCCIAGLMLGWSCLNFSRDYIARTIAFNLSFTALLWLFCSRPAKNCIVTKDGVEIRRVK